MNQQLTGPFEGKLFVTDAAGVDHAFHVYCICGQWRIDTDVLDADHHPKRAYDWTFAGAVAMLLAIDTRLAGATRVRAEPPSLLRADSWLGQGEDPPPRVTAPPYPALAAQLEATAQTLDNERAAAAYLTYGVRSALTALLAREPLDLAAVFELRHDLRALEHYDVLLAQLPERLRAVVKNQAPTCHDPDRREN